MNAPLRRVAVALVVLFGLLLLNVNVLQVLRAGDLRADPRNTRTLFERYDSERGPLLAVDGTVLAESVETGGALRFERRYPGGPAYAPVTGFYSFVYGSSGLERARDQVLSGDSASLVVRRLSDLLAGRAPVGASVTTTLVPQVQTAAYEALGGQRGAVVALDPRSGAVLALVTSPSYDPGSLSSSDASSVRAAWERLNGDPTRPLANRALSERYPPGSTFKVVTAAAALSAGATPGTLVDAPVTLPLPGSSRELRNFGGGSCAPTVRTSLADALRTSCNTSFGQLGLDLGAPALRTAAEGFGFGTAPQVPLQAALSTFPDDPDRAQTALSAIGQFDVAMTPLQGAMAAAGVANGGRVMAPYLVEEVQAPDLSTLSRARPETYTTATTPEVAAQLTEMMEGVVADGSGRRAALPGVRTAGKTGTAQQGGGRPPHAWFLGFAPADDPQVAVAVVVEDGGRAGEEATGGSVAAPVFRATAAAALASSGDLGDDEDDSGSGGDDGDDG